MMTHLRELIRTILSQNMKSEATSLDVSRVVEFLAGLLMDGFSDPNDPCRARFPQLHQTANAHREARTHTVLTATVVALRVSRASAQCVLRGCISETELIDGTTYKTNYGGLFTCGEGN
eukprot:3111263-Pleurochrysis_carterae.AAC.2